MTDERTDAPTDGDGAAGSRAVGSRPAADWAAEGGEGGEGGESACWLHRVCSECGRLSDAAPPAPCPTCGTPLGEGH